MKLVASPGGPVVGEAQVPGDKSISHRALILAAMHGGETAIRGLNDGEDVARTIEALRQLGATVEAGRVRGGRWSSPAATIDCGNSGTTARLLIGAVAGMAGVTARFDGDVSLRRRPMARLIDPLRRMGARIEGGPTLPLTVTGGALAAIEHVNRPASAQVKTALQLAARAAGIAVTVVEPMASRDHGEFLLGEFDDGARTIDIGGDPSAAAFPLLGAAIVPGSSVRVAGMNANPLRTGFLETLATMGALVRISNARVVSGERVADVQVAAAALRPCRVAAEQVPAMIDEIPALAVACAFAEGESVIEGLSELRVKESDRMAAIVAGLTACGVAARAEGDALRVAGTGRVPGGANVAAMGDHRIAMAFLTLGLGAEAPVTINDARMIATSFPGFVAAMRGLGASIG